jgi:hypothetical protein
MAKAGMTTVFEVGGDSMAPALGRGSRVLVVPLGREVRAGDVVVLQASGIPVLHRVVRTFREDGVLWLLHRGDHGGRSAAAPGAAVVGRAVALLAAGLEGVPTPDELAPRERRAFRRAQWLARGYVWARRAARALGRGGNHPGPGYNGRSSNEQGGSTDRPSAGEVPGLVVGR